MLKFMPSCLDRVDKVAFMPDPDRYLLKRAMEESYRKYTARRNRDLKGRIDLEYEMKGT